MSDRDILEAMQKSSARRYRPAGTVATVAPQNGTRQPIQRASRTAEQPQLVRKTIEYADDAYDDDEPITRVPRRTADYQQRRTADVDTNNDVQVAPSVRRLRDEQQAPPTKKLPLEEHRGLRFHWLLYVGTGMVVMLALWLIGVQILVGWTNGMHDPGYYSQIAHLDTTTVVVDAQGHQSQVRAFVDVQGHLDMLVLPSDMSKAHVIVGPALLFHDIHTVMLTVKAQGSVITVLAQGPLQANFLVTARESSSWIFDLKQPTSTGGH